VKIIYSPRDGERREWTWKPSELPSHEAELIEDAMDLPYQAFVAKWLSGSTRARRALLWVLLRRDVPALEFGQVRFLLDELGDDFDDDEVAAMRARLAENADSDDPVEQAALERIREVLADQDGAADKVADDMTAGIPAGKDTAGAVEPVPST
jgi:hypothetical protein